MKPGRLRKRWQRALTASLKRSETLLRRRGPLNATAVHDLRVALRRARLLLQLGNPHRDHHRTRLFRAAARQIMDVLAPIRDFDVTLQWVRAQQASPALLTRVLQERAQSWQPAERHLRTLRREARPPKSRALAKVGAEKLAARFTKWRHALAARCRADVAQAATFATPELHALRRRIRRWRYLEELVLPRREMAHSPVVRALIAAQEVLGAVQDGEVIGHSLARCGRSREVTRLRRQIQTELNQQRKAAPKQRALQALAGPLES
ncbi:MAG TPA: CHAD domain-containing protein [Verrucomicrobiae bacterium]|nr:CHAD domain-containing protein [Verrucomicrobiae bacterium]